MSMMHGMVHHMGGGADRLPRAANDSFRAMATVELTLRLKPTAASGVWRLDPQYREWAARQFPDAGFRFCPLNVYDRLVRPADARHTLDDIDAELNETAARIGGYALPELSRWWPRTAPFVIGSRRARALVEFLFTWG